MPASAHLRTPAAVCAWFALVLATCYNPNLESGKLRCSSAGQCPEGFFCQDNLCYAEGTGGTAGTGGTGGMCQPPYGPFPGCKVEQGGKCDPVCQAGCACGERCNLDMNNSLACKAQKGPFLDNYAECTPSADNCKPGLVCLSEVDLATCGSHCYRYCRLHTDCAMGAKCVNQVQVQINSQSMSMNVCGTPADQCDPTLVKARCSRESGRSSSTSWGCYILSQNGFPDLTTCDCAGTRKLNDKCDGEHQCEPGLECVDSPFGQFSGLRCRRVCNPKTQSSCPLRCMPFSGNQGRYGYCL